MKDFFKGLTILTLALLLFPAIPYIISAVSPAEPAVEASAGITIPKEPSGDLITEVNLYDTVADRVITLTTEEYMTAALAAQLSPSSDPELLKAQAVLMYTYLLRRRTDELKNPTPELHGCDLSNDASKYPRLILGDTETLDFEVYREIAREVMGEYCSYGGEPISVAYCYSAGSSTESALTVLGIDIPYLQAVPTEEPDAYHTTVTYTSDEVFARLTTTENGYILLGGAEGWITPKDTTANGYVQSVYLDSRFIVSGSEIARLLNLPSARFTFRYSEATDRFTFTVSGSGSLVGMSQRGAAVLASQGYNYREILLHFFKDIDLKQSALPADTEAETE